ncbi:hypothetical protein [Sphingobacterium anhuiense]|uniref:Uncharacterized protein n=1 Tax=Sphingobacterium anhuiense TaxID=493780 RepID=A0ABW5YTV9_9SPHI
MQEQTNRKGQFGKPPHRKGLAGVCYATTAICCRMVDRIGHHHHSLKGSCCCAGPVRDAHGRRFTTFPIGQGTKKTKQYGRIKQCPEAIITVGTLTGEPGPITPK